MIDERLKKIVVNSKKLYYKIKEETDSVFVYISTEFYETNDKYKFKKIGLFRKKITKKPNNKVIFTLPFAITDSKYTKDTIKVSIEEKLKIINREKEIKRGEIV